MLACRVARPQGGARCSARSSSSRCSRMQRSPFRRPPDVIDARFHPLRPAPRAQAIAAVLAGGGLWIAALVLAALVLHRRDSIEIAGAITAGSILVSLVV